MPQSKHKAHVKKHEAAPKSGDLAGFVKSKPWFVLWVVLALAVVILFFWSLSLAEDYSSEKNLAAKSFYSQNQMMLDQYISDVNEILEGPFETTLEDDYAYSAKHDLEWLKAMEKKVYESKPNSDVYAKELAFTFFFERLISLNEDVAYAEDTTDYAGTISNATNLASPLIADYNDLYDYYNTTITEAELDEMLLNKDKEKQIFYSTLTLVMGEYFAEKKLILAAEGSQERKYVEAKKLTFLSYRETES
ncbi:MAG: hypothetical protein AABW59_03065 [archaeon]